MDTAHSLADQGNGAAANALTRLEQRVKAIPIAAAQVKSGYRTGISSTAATSQPSRSPSGSSSRTPHRRSGCCSANATAHASVDDGLEGRGRRHRRRNGVVSRRHVPVHPPDPALGIAHDRRLRTRNRRATRRGRSFAQMDASAPGLDRALRRLRRSTAPAGVHRERPGSRASSFPDARSATSAVPLGTLDHNVLYVYLRPYQRASTIIRDSSMVYLMTLLAGRFNLFHAPWSLAIGVAGYEEIEYLNTKGYILAARAHPGCVPWIRQRNGLAVAGRGLGAERRSPADSPSRTRSRSSHVIIANHGGQRGDHPAGQAVQAAARPAGLGLLAGPGAQGVPGRARRELRPGALGGAFLCRRRHLEVRLNGLLLPY